MRFDTSQHMRLGQQMRLAPRMIQSMEILQMPLAELEERIEQELESNPTLEIAEQEADRRALAEQREETERDDRENERPLDVDEEHGTADFERLESFEEANPEIVDNQYGASRREDHEGHYSRSRQNGERDGKLDAMAAAPARSASLGEQLLEQWHLSDVPAELQVAGELILGFIEDDGYLRTPLETIADRAPAEGEERITPGLLLRALMELQRVVDPPGTGARDVRECLLLQIEALDREASDEEAGVLETVRKLVEDHLDDVAQNRLPRIVEKTGLTLEQIKSGIEQMKRLSLAPARRLVNDSLPPIVPDAIVEYNEEQDRYIAYLNETRLPNLQLNREYALMSRDRSVPQKDREFLRTNLSNAQWLIDAMNQRRSTLLRVIGVVVEAQRDFFDYGPQALRPLPMTQVAEQLGIHVATVSRAVADKYIQTPRGVLPLRKFFTGGLATDSGEDMSYEAVRGALQDVIAAEDKSKPLSDEAIVEELKKRGIEIARRTVAKYRDQLGIQSARLRRAY
jgi:RNA polymerase sigma-54 factor